MHQKTIWRLPGQTVMGLTLGLASFILSACTDPSQPPPPMQPPVDEPVELQVTVVVSDTSVTIYPREVERPCECEDFTPIGVCDSSSDVPQCGCTPAPGACLDRFAVYRDGVEVIARDYESSYGSSSLQLPGGLGGEAHTLVLEGCGGRAEIPLPAESLGEVTITDATIDLLGATPRMTLTWTGAEPATSAETAFSTGFTAEFCHQDAVGSNQIDVPTGQELWFISVTAYDGGEPVDMELGTAHVWRSAHGYINSVWPPALRPDGRYGLRPRLRVTTDTENSALALDVALVDMSASTPLLELTADSANSDGIRGIDYRAGVNTDIIRLQLGEFWYEGQIPHISVDALFWPELDVTDLEIPLGTVALVNAEDASDTRTENITLHWHITSVLRPLALAP